MNQRSPNTIPKSTTGAAGCRGKQHSATAPHIPLPACPRPRAWPWQWGDRGKDLRMAARSVGAVSAGPLIKPPNFYPSLSLSAGQVLDLCAPKSGQKENNKGRGGEGQRLETDAQELAGGRAAVQIPAAAALPLACPQARSRHRAWAVQACPLPISRPLRPFRQQPWLSSSAPEWGSGWPSECRWPCASLTPVL